MKKNDDWKKAVDKALTYIGLTISPGQYGRIQAAKDGTEAWKALANIYKKTWGSGPLLCMARTSPISLIGSCVNTTKKLSLSQGCQL